ncbi:MAG: EamA family transporter [Candidatus Aenigmarchaeota archaeon]|nr:EamA family transporter [Candidatus Aenigmarchaeota archaeon]
MNKENIGTLFAIITALISGLAFVANKFFLVSLDPTLFTSLRTFFVGIGFFLISFFKNKLSFKNFNKVSWKILLSIGFVAGFAFLTFFNGLKLTTAGRAAFLHKLLPLFITVFAFTFLKEKIKRIQVYAMIVMISGTYFISFSAITFDIAVGDFLVIIATILFAVENIISKYAMIKKESNFVVSFCRMFFASIILFSIVLMIGSFNQLLLITHEQVLYIGISVSILFLYVFFWYYSISLIKISKASTLLLLSPPISLFLSYLFLEETILPLQIIGSILILIGAFTVSKIK